jgi:hypothetical protein
VTRNVGFFIKQLPPIGSEWLKHLRFDHGSEFPAGVRGRIREGLLRIGGCVSSAGSKSKTAASRIKKKNALLQLRVLRPGFFQDGNVGLGILSIWSLVCLRQEPALALLRYRQQSF